MFIYPIALFLQKTMDPVEFLSDLVVMIPSLLEQLITLSQRLMAPPAAPQVSGRVIQASV